MGEQQVTECHACRYETETERYERGIAAGDEGTPMNLCRLCASTMSGNALQYPRQYPQAEVLFTICHVGNAIIDAIKENGGKK